MRKHLIQFMLSCAAVILFPLSSAFAADTNLTAQASFSILLTAVQTLALDFSPGTADVEISGVSNTDVLRVATNDARTETGTFFTIQNATGQAGVVTVTGTTGEVVDVSCDATSMMENAGGNQIQVSAIEYALDGVGAAAGGGTACAGLGSSPGSFTLDGTDTVRVGGTIVANSGDGVEVGDYSTTTATDPIVVRTIYQ